MSEPAAPPLAIREFIAARLDEAADRIQDAPTASERAYLRRDINAKHALQTMVPDFIVVSPTGYGHDELTINAAIERASDHAKMLKHLASIWSDHPSYRADFAE
jgi:hypothetical protein